MFQDVTSVYLYVTATTSEKRHQAIYMQLKFGFLCCLSRFVTGLHLG